MILPRRQPLRLLVVVSLANAGVQYRSASSLQITSVLCKSIESAKVMRFYVDER